jgi:hypothetical protein
MKQLRTNLPTSPPISTRLEQLHIKRIDAAFFLALKIC